MKRSAVCSAHKMYQVPIFSPTVLQNGEDRLEKMHLTELEDKE